MGCFPANSKKCCVSSLNEDRNSPNNKMNLLNSAGQSALDKNDKIIHVLTYKKGNDSDKAFMTSENKKTQFCTTFVIYERLLKRDIMTFKSKRISAKTLVHIRKEDGNASQNESELSNIPRKIKSEEDEKKENINIEEENIPASVNNPEFDSKELTATDISLIKGALTSHFLFNGLSNAIIEELSQNLFLFQMYSGDHLFIEGEKGHFFFIVKSGAFELTIRNITEKKYFRHGDTFGELALLHRTRRSGAMKCIEDAEVFLLQGNIFRQILRTLNQQDLKERISFLRLLPIFNGLDTQELSNVAMYTLKCEFKEGHEIIKEGDQGDSLFIIKEGIVSCIKSDQEVRRLCVKEYFGESSILFQTKRALSIVSITPSVIFQLSKSDLLLALGENFKNILLMAICREGFRKSKNLRYLLIDGVFSKIFPHFVLKFYRNSQVIYDKDNICDNQKLVLCIEGNLIKSTTLDKVASRCEIYGEEFIINENETIDYDVIAMTDCIALECTWKDILSVLDCNLEGKKLFKFFSMVVHLKKIEIFQHLSDRRLLEIAKVMKKVKFTEDQVIIKEGSEGSYLYFLCKGKVKVYKDDKFIREYQDYVCFGEISIVLNEPHSATAVSASKVSTYILSKEDFKTIIDENMNAYLVHKISLLDPFSTTMDSLYYVKTLGEGKFGHVSLVHNQKNAYAIKAVNRKLAEKKKMLIKYFQKERNILLSIDHAFIVKLVKTLKNEDYIFYLMEFVQGISMGKYLEKRSDSKLRNKDDLQFYTSCLLIVINYLHSKHILHRDLKPENIMLDHQGYPKLIDFNTAVVIKDLTSTIAGTPHYIAPEILLGKGYNFSVDYWSIGVIAFEIFFGHRPFGQDASDPMEIYREIVKKQLIIPVTMEDTVVNFLIKLLNKKVNERICNLEQLKMDKFFANFDWVRIACLFFQKDAVIDLKKKVPYVPPLNYTWDSLLGNTKLKYEDKIKRLVNCKSESFMSSGEEEDTVGYNPNWADEF